MNNNQTTRTPRRPPPPQGQGHPQPAQPSRTVIHHPGLHQSYFQMPPPPAYNPQRTVPPPSRPISPEKSAFYTNCDYSSQGHRQQHQYQQHQYHVPPPVAQPPPQPAARPNYNSYQPTAGYPWHHVPHPASSPQPHLACYSPDAQPQKQKRFHHTLPQVALPAKRQRFGNPDLNRQAQHYALPPSQPQFQSLPSPTQNTEVYLGQSQGSGHGDGDGDGDGWLNNVQPNTNKERRGGNCRGWHHRRSARGGSMLGRRGEIADSSQGGSHLDSEGGSGCQSGGGVRARKLEGNFGDGRNTISTSVEPAPVPVATQLQGAQNVNVSGNPTLMNIGTNTGNLTTVNNFGGTHGLEKLENFVSFAALHNSAEQDHTRRCHPGTRENVLKRLRHWINNPTPFDRIFWLRGPAGAGKSAIAQTIAHTYKRQDVAATFFFYRSDPNRSDGNRLFTTIAWQLAFSIPAIKDFVVKALDELPHLPRTDVETQFEELIVNPFRAMNHMAFQMLQHAPVVIIDGVDECLNEKLQQRFLNVIRNAVENHHFPLRFLIVSRPEALIEENLNNFKNCTVSIDLAKLEDSNHDIQKYLKDKFSEIASNRGLDSTWPGQEIIQKIVFKSSGNFIFASLVIRFISDEDYDPEFLLNIVRNLAPHGNNYMSPFALLDELFLEILRRQRDQDFLKTFLALLVGRISIGQGDLRLHEDDATLMNVSEKDLHIRLRRMRSLLKFEPFIDLYHKSFLDFLQDPSRSSQYHVSKEDGQKRYLELVVESVVRHISMVIEQPNCHETCRFSLQFKSIVTRYPPEIVLPTEDWQEALNPLLDLQNKLLETSKPQSCRVTQIIRDLLLHLVFLRRKSHSITVAQSPESDMNETVTEWGSILVTEIQQNAAEKDLDSCLSALLSCLQKTDSVMVVNRAIIDHMFSLLAFDCVETVARVRSVSDAQKLIDLVDLLINNKSFLGQCGRDAACKASRLASELFARVPHLPQSLVLNRVELGVYTWKLISDSLELGCQSAFISRILDHNYIIPVLGICDGTEGLNLASSNEYEQNESVHDWLESSNPDLVTRIRVILEIARTIRYIHSMDVALFSKRIQSECFFLNSNLRTKFDFIGLFTWWVKEASNHHHEYPLLTDFTYESNISAFGRLFREVFSKGNDDENLSNRLAEDVNQLIERCCAKNAKSQPTMTDVVTEMEIILVDFHVNCLFTRVQREIRLRHHFEKEVELEVVTGL